MEDYQRELENAIADFQIKHNITYEQAIDLAKKHLDMLLELRLMSKGVIKK